MAIYGLYVPQAYVEGFQLFRFEVIGEHYSKFYSAFSYFLGFQLFRFEVIGEHLGIFDGRDA